MGYKSNYLSQSNICAIYQCLKGHIHLKYRALDITMEPDEFYQVAEVITNALRTLGKLNEPATDNINLADIDVLPKA